MPDRFEHSFAESLEEELDQSLASLPGWTSRSERQFNQWYARKAYSGRGAIVDLGCMAGSSTMALLSGLTLNERIRSKRKLIHAYDLFVKYWEPRKDEPLEHIPTGCSFLPEFEHNLGDRVGEVVVHCGDIVVLGWDGGPIEYLFVDVMKSWKLARRVTMDFFPSLMPGVATVVQQDFKHYYTPWIHVLMYRLRDHLKPAYDVPHAESTVFRCVKRISPVDCATACRWNDLTSEEIDDIFSYSKAAVGVRYRPNVDATKAMLFAHLAGATEEETEANPAIVKPLDRSVEVLLGIDPRWDRSHNVRGSWRSVQPHFDEHRLRFAVPRLKRRIRGIAGKVHRRIAL